MAKPGRFKNPRFQRVSAIDKDRFTFAFGEAITNPQTSGCSPVPARTVGKPACSTKWGMEVVDLRPLQPTAGKNEGVGEHVRIKIKPDRFPMNGENNDPQRTKTAAALLPAFLRP